MSLTEDEIRKILNKVDNWGIKDDLIKKESSSDNEDDVEFDIEDEISDDSDEILNDDLFNTDDDENLQNLYDNKNKYVTLQELQLTYDEALKDALLHINHLDIKTVPSVFLKLFKNQVYKITAARLWKKYNVQKNDAQMEDVYITSYAGTLYKDAFDKLDKIRDKSVVIGLNQIGT